MLALWVSLQNRLASLRKEDGQALVEYGVIIALIAIVVLVVLTAIGGRLNGVFEDIRDALPL
jgi:pilus assembly protein Flp/PilA